MKTFTPFSKAEMDTYCALQVQAMSQYVKIEVDRHKQKLDKVGLSMQEAAALENLSEAKYAERIKSEAEIDWCKKYAKIFRLQYDPKRPSS